MLVIHRVVDQPTRGLHVDDVDDVDDDGIASNIVFANQVERYRVILPLERAPFQDHSPGGNSPTWIYIQKRTAMQTPASLSRTTAALPALSKAREPAQSAAQPQKQHLPQSIDIGTSKIEAERSWRGRISPIEWSVSPVC